MAGKTLTAANLEALGAPRLAALLLELGAGDPGVKRRLRLAVAGGAGPAEAVRMVGKRLATIAASRTFLEWQKAEALAAELESQRRAILELVAPGDPRGAFELVWRLLGCADPVLSRADDGNGELVGVFQQAAEDLGLLAQASEADPAALAERLAAAIRADVNGIWDELTSILEPSLGPVGLRRLGRLMQAWQAEPVPVPKAGQRQVIGWGSGGALYADELDAGRRRAITGSVLRQVAAALGDVDLYVAQFDARTRTVPRVAADLAERLLQAGRASEAWTAIEAAAGDRRAMPIEWERARIATLEALGRPEEAQEARWRGFSARLDPSLLRDFMRQLPDFEDFEAEQRGLTLALGHPDLHRALAFLVAWPDLPRASQLVLGRAAELDGDDYATLSAAADALQVRHPLAATLLRRAMIDYSLGVARSSRYKHAARHLAECEGMARQISDFGTIPDHAAYEKALRATHGRKDAFWQEVGTPGRSPRRRSSAA